MLIACYFGMYVVSAWCPPRNLLLCANLRKMAVGGVQADQTFPHSLRTWEQQGQPERPITWMVPLCSKILYNLRSKSIQGTTYPSASQAQLCSRGSILVRYSIFQDRDEFAVSWYSPSSSVPPQSSPIMYKYFPSSAYSSSSDSMYLCLMSFH